jgi:hypothetical protein
MPDPLDPRAVKLAELLQQGVDYDDAVRQARGDVNDGPTEQERQMQERLTALRGGDHRPPGTEPPPDPHEAMLHEFHAARSVGDNREKAFGRATQHLIDAAVRGDARVVQQPGESLSEANARWLAESRERRNRYAQDQRRS